MNRPSKTRVALLIWYTTVIVIGGANILNYPLWQFSSAPQPPPANWILLRYPSSNGSGQYMGNKSGLNYIGVQVIMAANTTIVESTPVNGIDHVHVASAMETSTLWWTRFGGIVTAMAFLVGVPELATRRGKSD